MLARGIALVHAGGPSCAAVVGSIADELGASVWQQDHALPGGWWRAVGGCRRLQCAQSLLLGQPYRGRCDPQGGHDVRDGQPGHDPQ
jgi:hypothetical protein